MFFLKVSAPYWVSFPIAWPQLKQLLGIAKSSFHYQCNLNLLVTPEFHHPFRDAMSNNNRSPFWSRWHNGKHYKSEIPWTKTSTCHSQVKLWKKKLFRCLVNGWHNTSQKACQPKFSREWQGVGRKHATNILGHTRVSTCEHTQANSRGAVKGSKNFYGMLQRYILWAFKIYLLLKKSCFLRQWRIL